MKRNLTKIETTSAPRRTLQSVALFGVLLCLSADGFSSQGAATQKKTEKLSKTPKVAVSPNPAPPVTPVTPVKKETKKIPTETLIKTLDKAYCDVVLKPEKPNLKKTKSVKRPPQIVPAAERFEVLAYDTLTQPSIKKLQAVIVAKLEARTTINLKLLTPKATYIFRKTTFKPMIDILSFTVTLKGKVTPILVTGISEKGEIFRLQASLNFPEYEEFLKNAKAPVKKYGFSVALGTTALWINQTDLEKYFENTPTLKLSAHYTLKPNRWRLGVNTFINLFPISRTNTNITARFLGINAKVIYTLSHPNSRATYTAGLGVYYLTMLVTNRAFGVRDLFGPELILGFSTPMTTIDRLALNLKFSPISDGTFLMGLANREIAVSLATIRTLEKLRTLEFSIDYANLKIALGSKIIGADSLTAGVGYGF